jgi:hypothetical protein
MRFVLGATMIAYGMIKVIPVQMTDPSLSDLVTPFGSLLPQRVLWTSIGAAPVYEIFAGCAEVLGGILLFIPRSVMLGALICLADLVQVFMLNVGYDVQVKLYSFHLLLMAVLLLAPDLPRLANLFFMNRAAGPSTQPQLFLARRANRRALAAQILVGIWLLGMNSYRDWHRWHVEGSAAPKPPLYGIWDVEQFSIDGQIRAPLFTDRECWRRAIFNSGYFSNRVVFQRMDDSLYFAALDFNGKTLSLTTPFDKNWKATFAVQRVEQDQLTLDGEMGGHKVHAQLRLFDHNKFPLVNHRMGWIRE